MMAIRDPGSKLTISGMLAVAETLERPDPWEFVANELASKGLDGDFIQAMLARGISILSEGVEIDVSGMNFDQTILPGFLTLADFQKCRVYVNGELSGAGCLIGPSLVLTAWHVVRNSQDGRVETRFRNLGHAGSRGAPKIRSGSVVEELSSECSPDELIGKPPHDDSGYAGYNDVAVIRLDRSEGMRVGFLQLPSPDNMLRSNDDVFVMHYPDGANSVSFSRLRKIANVTARWKYSPGALPGSSGGACVNRKFVLAGIHQGAWGPDKRLVPASLFLAGLMEAVARDVAPTALWSLDDTIDGRLVLGRDPLFEFLAASCLPASRTRGIRIKRTNLESETGLNFSLDAVSSVLAREPDRNVIIRTSFAGNDDELFPLIARALQKAGYNVRHPPERPGIDHADTTLEASLNETARSFATQIEALSSNGQRRFWFMFENAPGGIRDVVRYQFEAFFAAAIAQPNLRVIVAGFETVTTPGIEERFPLHGESAGVHVVVDYIGYFDRPDVVTLIDRAGQALGIHATADWAFTEADAALLGLPPVNGFYELQTVGTVVERIRSGLKRHVHQEAAQ